MHDGHGNGGSGHAPQTFVLAFADKANVSLSLPVPQGPVTLPQALPAVFALADAVFAHSARALADMGKAIACGPGCGVCCNHLVPISIAEAVHVAGVVASLPAARLAEVESRFRCSVAALDSKGLLHDLVHGFSERIHEKGLLEELQRRYWQAEIPCPFLENGSCSIHAHRPVICRQYSVTSQPKHCADPYGPGQGLEKILHPLDLGAAIASFDGARATPTRAVPLTLTLLMKKKLAATPFPRVPGPEMLSRLLNYAARVFAT